VPTDVIVEHLSVTKSGVSFWVVPGGNIAEIGSTSETKGR
jgi:hypothetical protein